jgi:diadenylate cyclase
MFFDFFLTFKWHNLIDILVISFIIHRILLFLRGSAAYQLMLGLISLLILQIVAHLTGLVLTSWFLGGLSAVALLVIVILFRWEIRELLIRSNPVHFLSGRPPLQSSNELEPLITAVYKLVHSGTGALIVLQNHDLLSQRLRPGYELNGNLISQIIESIFTKDSPVHDGAIVISHNRIKWVGTFLPLTNREGLPKHFGTRHMAAIGLTERTDATVIVVSEERGEVALVEKGLVKMIRNEQDLRNHLMIRPTDKISNQNLSLRTRVWLLRMVGYVSIVVLVAAFWGFYFGRQSLIELNSPIDFRNIGEDVLLEGSSSEDVDIRISGNRIMINQLEASDARMFVDLKGFDAGVHVVDLEGKNVELPTGLTVTRLSPPQIQVELSNK